jgi:hypothetical protein
MKSKKKNITGVGLSILINELRKSGHDLRKIPVYFQIVGNGSGRGSRTKYEVKLVLS